MQRVATCALVALLLAVVLPLLGAYLASEVRSRIGSGNHFDTTTHRDAIAILRPPWYRHNRKMVENQTFYIYPKDSKTWHGHMGLVNDPKTDLGLDYENVSFPSRNPGYTLRGWYVPAPNNRPHKTGIITQHGGGHDRRECLRVVPIFHMEDIPVLLYDASEHGISDGDGGGLGYGYREMYDLMGAVDFVESTYGWENIIVFGTSVGAATAIKAAAEDERIDVIIAENPFHTPEELWDHAINTALGTAGFGGRTITRFGNTAAILQKLSTYIPRQFIDLIIAIAKLRVGGWGKPAPADVVHKISPRPLLFIHSKEDDVIMWTQTEALYEKCGDPKHKLVTDVGKHAAVYNDNKELFTETVLQFIRKFVPALNKVN